MENELSNFALYFFSGLFVISFLTSVDVNDAAEEYFATVFDDFFMLKYKNFYMHVEDFFVDGWYFDSVYNHYISQYCLKLAYKVFYIFDAFLLEAFGPRGIVYISSRFGLFFGRFQTGSLFDYLSILLVGTFVVFSFVWLGV